MLVDAMPVDSRKVRSGSFANLVVKCSANLVVMANSIDSLR